MCIWGLLNTHIILCLESLAVDTPITVGISNTHMLFSNTILQEKEPEDSWEYSSVVKHLISSTKPEFDPQSHKKRKLKRSPRASWKNGWF